MDNISREKKVLRKNQKERLGTKSTVIEMKTVSNGLMSRWDPAEERIHELEKE